MRVKRLEIQGFKSFKDKTVIHFDHTITGIVGPNGCGKSNIVDAFFWVMGEQSYKHMRGSGSEDLIFNGSAKFSPLGMAEATLVMETEFSGDNAAGASTGRALPVQLREKEVAVTRRVYRSGEGEYFINGVPARLKDIQELFMDTGVGAKGYSVIEQGQIGKIVNAKPEDRRLLIEEAAGIAKYKARKKESLRKMEATQANLARLNDVIAEIERNVHSLERQAQKAKLYRRYKDELLDKEMTWGRRKAQVLKQKLQEMKDRREKAEQELIGLRAELQASENSIEAERATQLTSTKAAEDFQNELQDLSSDLTREQSALELSRSRQGDLKAQLESLSREKQELESATQNDRETLVRKSAEAEEGEGLFTASASRAQKMDEEVREVRQNAEAARRALDTSKRDLMLNVTRFSDLNTRAASLQSRSESALAQAQRLQAQIDAQLSKVASAREESERAAAASGEIRAKRDSAVQEKTAQAEQVHTDEEALRAIERAQNESSGKTMQLRSRLQSLQELEAAYEGYADGPKAALEWARNSGRSEQVRAMADLFHVQAGYESAVEGWLEGRLQSLVSENPQSAFDALEHVRERNQGRAGVQVGAPSGFASPRATESEIARLLRASGFEPVGKLSEFVLMKDSSVASTLLEGVYVVDSFAPLARFLEQLGLSKLQGWSLVSREGMALDNSGFLRGGSMESSAPASLLGRKRAIAELEEKLREAEAAQEESEREAERARQKAELSRARLHQVQADAQSLEIQLAALERDVHQTKRALGDCENQLELLRLEQNEISKEAADADAERARISVELESIAALRCEMDSKIQAAEADLAAREIELRAQETELHGLRVSEAELRERSQALKREVESARERLADRERRLAEVTRVLERAAHEQEQFSGSDAELESRITDLSRKVAEKRDQLAAVKDAIEQSNAKITEWTEKVKQLNIGRDEKSTEGQQLAIDLEKASGDLAHLVQNMEEKYGPGCLERPTASGIQEEMSEPVVTAEMTVEEEQTLAEEVERLRERIRRLGEVNVMAITEYEEMKARFDHLSGEKADLELSIKNLEEAIEHINKTSEERFKKAFAAIADRFERLFPIIFGGGQAQLSLIYPEGSNDILEAGVDILASPPGKKVTNIGLLSGGEKALTAVSLIFAIFMVKPSPFCVLDEVDAPLDDANVGKFNALLREMSAKSQFILITHNKKTMELNDTLYGVTMEEPGVSKMVSIEMH